MKREDILRLKIVLSFFTLIEISTKKYDRARVMSSSQFASIGMQRTLMLLKNVYIEWRNHLKSFVGERDAYLDRFSEAEYKDILEKMKNDSESVFSKYASLIKYEP